MADPAIPIDLVDSPIIVMALETFITEAVAEATDMLTSGDTATKIALVKMVLAESFKARRDSSGVEAEKTHAATRELIETLMDGVIDLGADDDADANVDVGGAG